MAGGAWRPQGLPACCFPGLLPRIVRRPGFSGGALGCLQGNPMSAVSGLPYPHTASPQHQAAHRALDRCAQVTAALRAIAGLLAPTDEFSAVSRDDLAMLLTLLAEPLRPLHDKTPDIVAARSAVADIMGCRQELQGLTRQDLRALIATLGDVQASAVASLSHTLLAQPR